MQYIQTDHSHDVLISIREVSEKIQRLRADPHQWKWMIIASVAALSGAMICNLTGSTGVGPFEQKSRGKLLKHLNIARAYQGLDPKTLTSGGLESLDLPELRLMAPKYLLTSIQKEEREDSGSGPCIIVSQAEEKNILYLIEQRNMFMHFEPMSVAQKLNGLPRLHRDLFNVLNRIILDGHSFRYLSEESQAQLKLNCQHIIQLLDYIFPTPDIHSDDDLC